MTESDIFPLNPEGTDEHDDFVTLDETSALAVRNKEMDVPTVPKIQCNTSPTKNAFLVSVNPPPAPKNNVKHVPCDIVLVIDISGSMGDLAPLPGVEDEREREATNLSVLDLVRHASRTIISTLDEHDRLALVTFSQEAQIVQSLTSMTENAKAQTLEKIEKFKHDGATNLWDGIRTGLEQFEKHKPLGNVQGLFVLTDGQPNYMCPPQGYIAKLKPLLEKLHSTKHSAPTIQTFGFGYTIRSDLMLSIAKVGNGNFAFIPDVGMIGTVFVHAVANLYATYATNAVLEIALCGVSKIELRHDSGLPFEIQAAGSLRIKLGNIIYGQSRDLVIHHTAKQPGREITVNIKLTYTSSYAKVDEQATAIFKLDQAPTLPQSTLHYHLFRDRLCKTISLLYPVSFNGENATVRPSLVGSKVSAFDAIVDELAAISESSSQPDLASLLLDLTGIELHPQKRSNGQIYQALQTDPVVKGPRVFKSYWEKWGRHYLSSLWCAHMRQTCNSFKDPGPLRYGIHSELFKRCRDELDAAFDSLPPPKGTLAGYATTPPAYNNMGAPRRAPTSSVPISMSRFNRYDNPCFTGSCPVNLAGSRIITVDELRPGMTISSPLTGTTMTIAAILKSPNSGELCRVGDNLWITPWHPIFDTASKHWAFPRDIADEVRIPHDPVDVFSILFNPSNNVDDHALNVGGVSCVTLGHGLVVHNDRGDVRSHPFWGSHEKIRSCLYGGVGVVGVSVDECGRYICVSRRDGLSGEVVGLGSVGGDDEREREWTTTWTGIEQRDLSMVEV